MADLLTFIKTSFGPGTGWGTSSIQIPSSGHFFTNAFIIDHYLSGKVV
jgi:hypothetical protein